MIHWCYKSPVYGSTHLVAVLALIHSKDIIFELLLCLHFLIMNLYFLNYLVTESRPNLYITEACLKSVFQIVSPSYESSTRPSQEVYEKGQIIFIQSFLHLILKLFILDSFYLTLFLKVLYSPSSRVLKVLIIFCFNLIKTFDQKEITYLYLLHLIC